jgi:tetratricopeptide (TPR) repeat protein
MAARTNDIEALLAHEQWTKAEEVIAKALEKEPEDHWLWARLAGVKYEQRDYQGALEAAEKSLKIVPDCPLALWSKANALEMLGNVPDAGGLYLGLFRRGLDQLKNPDEDADECWEGMDWTTRLMNDCLFRLAGCMAKLGERDKAIRGYLNFLRGLDLGTTGIHTRDDALECLRKLTRSKKAKREALTREMESLELQVS